ncbi:MAG: hypothetical protein NTV84_11855 [Methanoregula sp.]|nr:hypothetical protein [Methanoregula sp.]
MCCLDNHIVPERSSRAFGAVLLLDQTATVGFARLSLSGLAMNILIDDGLHMIPMRSLIQVLTGHNRKAPRFVPKKDVEPEMAILSGSPCFVPVCQDAVWLMSGLIRGHGVVNQREPE